MEKKKNNFKNDAELMDVLSKIKISLYLIAALLLINVVVNTINTGNTWSLRGSEPASETEGGSEDEIPEYDASKYTEVDYKGLKNVMKEDGTHVIYFGRETCSFCAMFIPVMNEAQEKYGFKTYYFDVTRVWNYNTNTVVDQTAYEELTGINDFFEENFLATPMVVIYKDGKYVDGTMGYQEIDTYSAFLEKNNFKEK